jgi:hypothetical protein
LSQTTLVSISPTFNERLLHQNHFAKKLQTQIICTLKLCKKISYKKVAHKILVKLTPRGIYKHVHLSQDDMNRIGSICVSMPKVATVLALATLISFA